MTRTTKPPRDPGYHVGYRCPPRDSQFKPGQSGNPRGRPRRDTSLLAILGRSLNELVTIRIEGRPRRVPLSEALIRKMLADAARGDHRARAQILKLEVVRAALAADADKEAKEAGRSEDLLPDDRAILDQLKQQLLEEVIGEYDAPPPQTSPSRTPPTGPAPVRSRPRPEKLP